MNFKHLTFLLAVGMSIVTQTGSEAQLVKKAGGYIARKVLGESTERAGKSAGRIVVTKSARSAGKKASTSVTRMGINKGSRSASSRLTKMYGDDAARAMKGLSSQNSRRLQMMAGSIEKSGQGRQLMTFLAKRKDSNRIVEFLYRHRGKLIGGAIIAVVANPDKILGAASDSVSKVIGSTGREMVKPIAKEAAAPIAHWFGFTFFTLVMIGLAGGIAVLFLTKRNKNKIVKATLVTDRSKLHRID